MAKIRVAVIFGSKSCEHDVSIITGIQALKALNTEKFDAFPVYIDRTGAWFTGEKLSDIAVYKSFSPESFTRVFPVGEEGKLVLRACPLRKKTLFAKECAVVCTADVVVPALHGLHGEDGTLQGMLELFGVPYTSSGVLGSSVGMDKIAMKALFRGCGFPVLESTWFDRGDWAEDCEAVMDKVEAALPYPVFVKPANLGSSIGISRADDRAGLHQAIEVAIAYDRRIIVERGIRNRLEVNCSVLGYAGYVRPSVLEMPEQVAGGLLSFDIKYLKSAKGGQSKGMTSLSRQIPAPISPEMTQSIQELSVRVFREMDLKGCVRIDFIIDADTNDFYICEVNTIPGSLAFYLWEPAGVPYGQLLEEMITYAYRDRAERAASVFSYDSEILSRNAATGKLPGKLGTGKG